MYNITVMDQYSPAIVTVPANMSSVQFPYNGTSIVANREYNITVSAISDQGTSYPSDPVVVGKDMYISYRIMYKMTEVIGCNTNMISHFIIVNESAKIILTCTSNYTYSVNHNFPCE